MRCHRVLFHAGRRMLVVPSGPPQPVHPSRLCRPGSPRERGDLGNPAILSCEGEGVLTHLPLYDPLERVREADGPHRAAARGTRSAAASHPVPHAAGTEGVATREGGARV
eukprot:scaffold267188_cov32-Tisochrysis_lutea.AAC.5